MRQRQRALPHRLPAIGIGRQCAHRLRDRVDIAVRDREPGAFRGRGVGQDVAGGRQDRQTRPQAIEETGAEREARLEVLVVEADRHVRIAQVIDPLRIGHPAVIEEDAGIEQSVILGQLLRATSHDHRWNGGVRVAAAHEVQLERWHLILDLCHRLDRGQRVEPVPDSAGPQHHQVAPVDPGDDALDGERRRFRGLSGKPEGHHIDQRSQTRIRGEGIGIDPVGHRERAQPVVTLALAGTEQEVGGFELLENHLHATLVQRHAIGDAGVPEEMEVLEQEWAVHVHDEVAGPLSGSGGASSPRRS